MKTPFLGISAAALLLVSCTAKIDTSVDIVSTVYTNANIITQDADNPRANAMAVTEGRITSVFNAAKDFEARRGIALIDMQGATIMPGFIDSHVHVRELGMDAVKADLVGVQNIDDIINRLTAYAPKPKTGTWIIGQGWDEGYFGSIGYPDRAKLDAAFPNNPIALESLHGFGGFYNGAALAIAGIDKNTAEPEVGNILRRDNGEPTGVMLTLAQDLVDKHIPAATPAQRQAAIKAGLLKMGRAGVTSIHEAGMSAEDAASFTALADKGELSIRVYGMLDGNNETLMQQWFARGPLDDPDDWLDIRGVKVFYDGSLGSRTALMAAPYSDHPEKANPTERINPAAVLSLGERAAKHGFQMAVHAIGDEGNNRTLGLYEKALASLPSQDHRWRIEHAQVVLPDFYERLADMGGIASIQSSHAVGDSGWAEDRVGAERIKHAYAWRRILDAGGRLALNSDLPGEPWEPMETLYFAVTRKRLDGSSADDGTPDDGWYTDQALSVDEALKAMTLDNAYAAFQEAALGSLETGKWADFIVMSEDPTQVTPDALKDITITQIFVAGKPLD